jgi:hypothetical protein
VTVKELIAHLQTCPQDYDVVYRCCSDYSGLTADEIVVQHATDELGHGSVIRHHNLYGGFRRYEGPHEYRPMAPLPVPAGVVKFPGN